MISDETCREIIRLSSDPTNTGFIQYVETARKHAAALAEEVLRLRGDIGQSHTAYNRLFDDAVELEHKLHANQQELTDSINDQAEPEVCRALAEVCDCDDGRTRWRCPNPPDRCQEDWHKPEVEVTP